MCLSLVFKGVKFTLKIVVGTVATVLVVVGGLVVAAFFCAGEGINLILKGLLKGLKKLYKKYMELKKQKQNETGSEGTEISSEPPLYCDSWASSPPPYTFEDPHANTT